LLAEVLEAQPGGERGVVLGLGGEGAEDRAGVGLGQEMGDLAGVGAQVLAEIRGVRRDEGFGGVLDEGVHEDVVLRRPPAVDRLFGHAGAFGDPFDGQPRVSDLHEQVVDGFQHALACFFAAAVPVPAVSARLGAHRSFPFDPVTLTSCLDATVRLR
jgi:hypothetical protein